MVPPHFSHKHYVRFVYNKASRYGGLLTEHRHFQVWRKLKVTNLDAAYSILAALYSDDWGCMARHPVCMFRSCLAMMECGVTSFDVWVQMMRDDPFYALISGFNPWYKHESNIGYTIPQIHHPKEVLSCHLKASLQKNVCVTWKATTPTASPPSANAWPTWACLVS